jgi:proteic killer suppression protein
MIKSYKHRGLRKLWNKNDASGIDPRLLRKVRSRLSALNAAAEIRELDIPGFFLHRLKGNDATWSIPISGNWRITFSIEQNGDIRDVDLVDYH